MLVKKQFTTSQASKDTKSFIIKSINFDNYPFDVVCLEVFPHDIWDKVNEYLSSSVNSMMIEAGYSLQSVCGPTLIYLRKKSHH